MHENVKQQRKAEVEARTTNVRMHRKETLKCEVEKTVIFSCLLIQLGLYTSSKDLFHSHPVKKIKKERSSSARLAG